MQHSRLVTRSTRRTARNVIFYRWLQYVIFTTIILGLGKTTNSQDWFPVIQNSPFNLKWAFEDPMHSEIQRQVEFKFLFQIHKGWISALGALAVSWTRSAGICTYNGSLSQLAHIWNQMCIGVMLELGKGGQSRSHVESALVPTTCSDIWLSRLADATHVGRYPFKRDPVIMQPVVQNIHLQMCVYGWTRRGHEQEQWWNLLYCTYVLSVHHEGRWLWMPLNSENWESRAAAATFCMQHWAPSWCR
jgi:hypothetical protein